MAAHMFAAAVFSALSVLGRGAAQQEQLSIFPALMDSWFDLLATAPTGTALSPQAGPELAPAWTASISVNWAGGLTKGNGTLVRDAARQRYRMTFCAHQQIFRSDGKVCMDQLGINLTGTDLKMNSTVGEGSDAVCKAFPSPYADMFAALAVTTYRGNISVAGEPCALWLAQLPMGNISACIGADGVPRQFTTVQGFKQVLNFGNISIGPPSDSAFKASEACSKRWPMPPCTQKGVQQLSLYRVHGLSEPNDLENRNLGDALGDMAFFCAVGGLDLNKVVTSWSVEANASWGQYSYCLFIQGKNRCFGNTLNQVGRESAMGLGKGAVQGQCSANEDTGSWYSMPGEGQCTQGAPVGTGGCTWSAKRLRTVSSACIFNERGLKASCDRERGHAPMLRSAAIFRAALESSDVTKGGCPDVSRAWSGEATLMV